MTIFGTLCRRMEWAMDPPVVDEDWIREHGSNVLKRMFREGNDCKEQYFAERLKKERPGFKQGEWECQNTYLTSPAGIVSEKDFELLDRAREYAPDAELVVETYPMTGTHNFVKATFLGRPILMLPDDFPYPESM